MPRLPPYPHKYKPPPNPNLALCNAISKNLTARLVIAEKQIDTIQNSTALPEDVVAITAIVLAIGQLETAIFSAQPYKDALAIVQAQPQPAKICSPH